MATTTPETQAWSEETRKLIFATVAINVESAAQRALFEAVCVSSGLDPLRREVYPVVRKGRLSIQTGIDGYLKLANRTRELDGIELLFYGPDGVGTEVWLDSAPPVACLVRVYRKGCSRPFAASCRFDAYSQRNDMWRNFGETMLAKCTTTLALRRAFADVIGGIASADEMDQSDMGAPLEALSQGLPPAEVARHEVEPPKSRPAAVKVETKREARKETEKEKPSADASPDAPRPWFAGVPVIDSEAAGEPPSIATLRRVCAAAGLTRVGWAALAMQFGGAVTGDRALVVAKAMNAEKVERLNTGRDSLGVRTLVEEGDVLDVVAAPPSDVLGDW